MWPSAPIVRASVGDGVFGFRAHIIRALPHSNSNQPVKLPFGPAPVPQFMPGRAPAPLGRQVHPTANHCVGTLLLPRGCQLHSGTVFRTLFAMIMGKSEGSETLSPLGTPVMRNYPYLRVPGTLCHGYVLRAMVEAAYALTCDERHAHNQRKGGLTAIVGVEGIS